MRLVGETIRRLCKVLLWLKLLLRLCPVYLETSYINSSIKVRRGEIGVWRLMMMIKNKNKNAKEIWY